MNLLMGFLLGTLGLFYPLLIASSITLIFAVSKRSWRLTLLSAVLLYPSAWLFSKYPPYPWALATPLILVAIAFIFYWIKRNEKTQTCRL